MFGTIIVLIIVLMLGWIWNYQLRPHGYHEIPLGHILPKLRTGDVILFKALDNWNGPFIGCYFGHIGVVWIDPDDPEQIPYIFEAAGTRGMYLLPGQNARGIFCETLTSRVQKYKGYTFYKQWKGPSVPINIQRDFRELMKYASGNMQYEYDITLSSLMKGLGIEHCNNGTNCGELTMLSLIKLGILPFSEYERQRPHHLRDMCYMKEGIDGYYEEPLCIIFDPFTRT